MARETVVSVGEKYEVESIRLNDDGEGVVSIHGFTVFVPGLLPGERAQVQIQSTGKSFGRAALIQRHNAADIRVEAPCAVFDECGGCQLQHIPYDKQLQHKQQTVVNALRRVGRFDAPVVLPTIGMEDPWRYRNNVQVPVEFDGKGRFKIGFYAPGSHSLVPTEVCLLEPSAMEQTATNVASVLAESLGAKATAIHHLILRQSFSSGELMVILSASEEITEEIDVGQLDPRGSRVHPSLIPVANLMDIPHVVSVALTVQPDITGTVWGKSVQLLAGKPNLIETLGDVEFLISPRSFFQVNPIQTSVLYNEALQRIECKPDDHVLDAYCGTGTIALWLARHVGSVTGIEAIPDAIADARRNAEYNAIDNAEFIVGRVETEAPRLLRAGRNFDVVVLDPPRKGCDKRVLETLAELRPRQIVYVSCNPSTLARDLRFLVEAGYDMGTLQPVDMFPQTSHVECVVALSRHVSQDLSGRE